MELKPRVNVLLVDDQPSNLLALEAVLKGADLNLVRARSGEEALLRILDADFAVILMDVQMPEMDGFETAALIRERDRSKHTPIIFLTAFQSSERQIFQGYALGAVDYLAKPIVPAVLRSKIGVFVELFQATEQVRRQAAELQETQRRDHERALLEQKQAWELEWLRKEAAREKQAAEEQTERAEVLARTVAERIRAEEQLRKRAAQQSIVAEVGQRALADAPLPALMDEAIVVTVRNLGVEYGQVLELAPDGATLLPRAVVGWREATASPDSAGTGDETLARFTLLSNEPVVVEDVRTEARFPTGDMLHDHGILSGMAVVIPGRGSPFGTLGVFSGTQRTFTADDTYFLQGVANVLAAAIQRKRDEEEIAAVRDALALQLADMTRLHTLSTRLSHSLELRAVLEEVLLAVTGLQGTDAGVLALRDRERETMFTAASIGFTAEQLAYIEPTASDVLPVDAMSAVFSGAIRVDDVLRDPVLTPHVEAARRAGYHAICALPLLTVSGEMIGSLATYFHKPHSPSERETRLIELYARQAAQFIDNARLHREIREADRHKGEFLAMLAHELRNPLAPILNSLHLLRNGEENEDAVEARAVAERQVRHLARLVDDLLDVSRINSGKIQLRKGCVDLGEAVTRAIEAAHPLIGDRRHTLTVALPDAPVLLEADEARLVQVLANLLNNAAKYTEPGGRIELHASREDDVVVVRVRDNGIGVTTDLLPRVFDLFTQADRSLDRSQGGLGIGLTLVRRLVEMHGGSVAASSAGVGQGSEFTIRLPIGSPESFQEPKSRDTPAESTDSGEPVAKRVLVVDDNIDGARILARLLQANGHRTALAHDGPFALELAQELVPEVVLLDIGLPGMNGYEVAERLRDMEGLEGALLVALTGYGQESDRRRAEEAGFDLHLTKPVDPETILKLLKCKKEQYCLLANAQITRLPGQNYEL